ncbi:cytochrome b5 [Guyanagaster necrorhizus]|uniref:Cytochrome b5 n=1 Tax=Guyanagaster necrorhizus TaxID=856835 RepID=A0A9P8AXF4_9AGAR|nr:cytochrome b5 [Guyanagaster necrorhizus MCA 3950]KAG7451325.1 cytochrome b5 [Guyanagaster necrorhizus MCA 3950]
MAAYLRSWLTPQPAPALSSLPTPEIRTVFAPLSDDDDDDGDVTETERDLDVPPAFPSLDSAQRAHTSIIPKILSDTALMPPPPLPQLAVRTPGVARASSSLAVPPTTTKPPVQSSMKREKVALAPGHSPLDWAKLKSSGQDLRGVDTLLRIPPSVLKQHNTRDDAWSVFNGKVYNITPYLAFHPGGEKELMRVAGRDGTKLFGLTHAWVNVDFMLDACMIGFLIPEPTS